MSAEKNFFDTNILLYLLSEDTDKSARSEELLNQGGAVSVQVLNEFASVALRKLNLSPADVEEILTTVERLCCVQPLTLETHKLALKIHQRYRFSFYDALIVSSALSRNCTVLYTEDLQHGQNIAGALQVINPYTP